MKKLVLITAFLFCVNLLAQREFYELRIYELYQSSNINDFHKYFEDYLIPKLNKMGIKNIGVFKEASEDMPRKFYLFIPYPNITVYQSVSRSIKSDPDNAEASVKLNKKNRPMFNRYATSLFDAFEGMPSLVKPNSKNRFLVVLLIPVLCPPMMPAISSAPSLSPMTNISEVHVYSFSLRANIFSSFSARLIKSVSPLILSASKACNGLPKSIMI